jgi:hypothetical protein
MFHHGKLLLPPIALFLAGCTPTSGPSPNPPTVTWSVLDNNTKERQTFGPDATVHLTKDTYLISFLGESSGGLTAMTLNAKGNPICAGVDSSGLVTTVGNQPVSLPPINTTIHPAATSNSVQFTSFNFFQTDCHVLAHTQKGTVEAFADSGIITMTGTATDGSNRTSTGQLQITEP